MYATVLLFITVTWTLFLIDLSTHVVNCNVSPPLQNAVAAQPQRKLASVPSAAAIIAQTFLLVRASHGGAVHARHDDAVEFLTERRPYVIREFFLRKST